MVAIISVFTIMSLIWVHNHFLSDSHFLLRLRKSDNSHYFLYYYNKNNEKFTFSLKNQSKSGCHNICLHPEVINMLWKLYSYWPPFSSGGPNISQPNFFQYQSDTNNEKLLTASKITYLLTCKGTLVNYFSYLALSI